MTIRQGRNGEMRLEILKSAAAAFRRKGYYGASVDEIASALHMTKGNLYYYFKDKEDILFACHEFALDLLLKMLKKVEDSSNPPQEKLRRVIVSFVHMMIDELRGTALTMDVQALSSLRRQKVIAKRDRFDRGIRRIIMAGIKTGAFRKADPKLTTFAILGSVNWIPYWFDPYGEANSVEIGEEFAEHLISGLLNYKTKSSRSRG
ncbi:MAG TPA: TetR/AcrR family transcriptional regulator [Candidatus Limnocylindria bacterium]|nr:TetR/AcrR family transcriptional regulator [Candidatus Limnocylindria bacterium]